MDQFDVQSTDHFTPSVGDVKIRLTNALAATQGSAAERLNAWLQPALDARFTTDGNCLVRARDLGRRLSDEPAAKEYNVAPALDAKGTWAGIDKFVKSNGKIAGKAQNYTAATMHGPAGYTGGVESRFNIPRGFHVILFLAADDNPNERYRSFLGFDPDVTATTSTRNAWKKLVEESDDLDHITRTMLLGEAGQVIGPVIRRYHVDTEAKFPAVVHA